MNTENTAVLTFISVVRLNSPIIVAPAPAPMPTYRWSGTASLAHDHIPTMNRLPKIPYLEEAVKYMKFPASSSTVKVDVSMP